MSSAAGSLALVPLLAVAVVLGVSGVHGRRTHDPERAARAVEILAPTDDPSVAKSELDTFFETGWVGWELDTSDLASVCVIGGVPSGITPSPSYGAARPRRCPPGPNPGPQVRRGVQPAADRC